MLAKPRLLGFDWRWDNLRTAFAVASLATGMIKFVMLAMNVDTTVDTTKRYELYYIFEVSSNL